MTSLSDEKYLLLTTYKKDGTPVSTPVWIAALPDGRAGFTTDYDSWKVKRLKRNPKVMLQPCSVRGEPVPGSAITDAIAVAAPAGSAEHEAVERAIKKEVPGDDEAADARHEGAFHEGIRCGAWCSHRHDLTAPEGVESGTTERSIMVHARLDHVVIAVADLDEACERWGVAGLPAEPGGRHPAGTVNALVRGPGDAYVELISAPGSESNPWVNRVRDSGGGFLSWAIAVDDIHAAHSAIVEAGFTPQRIVDGSRRTPEGDEIGWLMCDLGPGPFDPDLPFLIQWTSPMIPGPQDGPVLDHLSVTPKDPDRLAELLTALGFVGDVTWPRRVFRAPGASAAGIVIQPLGGPVLADGAWAVAYVADSDEPSTVPATLTLRVPVERSSNLELDGVGLSVFGDRRRFAGAALLPIVEVVTESLRGGLTGWPSPRLDGSPPTESEYSRVSRPGRHALVGIRAEAWVAVLVEAGYATSADVDSSAALPDSRVALSRATRLTPSEPGGQPLTIGWGGADVPGSVLVIAVGKPPVILDVLPDCACDACDSGSADLIEAIDAAFLLVVSGGVYQVEHAPTRTVVTRTLDGWSAEGDLDSGRIERLLGDTEMGRVTDGVLRGAAWL